LLLPGRHFAGRPILKQILNDVFTHCEEPARPLARLAVSNDLVRYILEIINCAHRQENTHRSPPIARIVEQIKSHPEGHYSLTSLAEQAGLSLSRFKANFKSQVGLAPHEFILRCKVDMAKKLLLNPRRNVTSIAMELGFSSSQYFATVFRRFTNQTALEFRNLGPAVPLRQATSLEPSESITL
jgi:AraC-like DNA-binding protein